MTSITDGNTNTTTYSYDGLDRPTQITFADPTAVSYSYDGVGNLTAQTDPTGTYTYTYDALNRRVGDQLPSNRAITYTYDGVATSPPWTTAVSNDTVTDKDANTTTYSYDALDRLASFNPWVGLLGCVAVVGTLYVSSRL